MSISTTRPRRCASSMRALSSSGVPKREEAARKEAEKKAVEQELVESERLAAREQEIRIAPDAALNIIPGAVRGDDIDFVLWQPPGQFHGLDWQTATIKLTWKHAHAELLSTWQDLRIRMSDEPHLMTALLKTSQFGHHTVLLTTPALRGFGMENAPALCRWCHFSHPFLMSQRGLPCIEKMPLA